LKNKTINNHLACLAKMLGKAVDWEYLEKMPKIEKLKVEEKESDYLSFEEKEDVLAKSTGIIREMILFAIETGIRLGEILVVRWENIAWEDNGRASIIIKESISHGKIVTPKSNKPRYIPFTEKVVQFLTQRKRDTGYIFVDNNGNIIKPHIPRESLYKICDKIGMRRVGWHKQGTKEINEKKFRSITDSLETQFDANNKTKTESRNPVLI